MHSSNYEICFHNVTSNQRYLEAPAGSRFLHRFDHCYGDLRAVLMCPKRACQCSVRLEIPLEPPRDLYRLQPVCSRWHERSFFLQTGRNTVCVPASWVVTEFRDCKVTLRGPECQVCVARDFYVFGCNAFVPADLADRLSYVGAVVTYSVAKREMAGRIELFEHLAGVVPPSCICCCAHACRCASQHPRWHCDQRHCCVAAERAGEPRVEESVIVGAAQICVHPCL